MLKVVSRLLVIGLVVISWLGAYSAHAASNDCGGNSLLITEIQTSAAGASGSSNFRFEFVEIYNCTTNVISLDGYNVTFKNSEGQTTTTVALNGNIESKSFLWIGHNAYKTFLAANTPSPAVIFATTNGNLNALAADGGTVVLTNAVNSPVDTVNYGTQATMASVPASGQSIKRCMVNGDFVQTAHNAQDFVITALPTLSASFKLGPACDSQHDTEPADSQCQGIIINEFLPNPSGTDAGHEFIELYNPTSDAVSLKGCSLRIGESGQTFSLPEEVLQPDAYRVFSDTESGLVLPNKTGDTVWLLGATDEQAVQYADSLEDNQAWALIDGQWQASYSPTPLAANILLTEMPGRGALEDDCNEGYERNPETNRCRKITVATEARQPCKAGQARSSETNRCRTIATASTSLAVCQPGQERNPATNRCRRIAAVDDGLKPCVEGQERNPETNRCRKSLAASSPPLDKIQEAQNTPASDLRWWLASAAAVGVVSYGIYEWRQDLGRGFNKVKQKFGKKPPIK